MEHLILLQKSGNDSEPSTKIFCLQGEIFTFGSGWQNLREGTKGHRRKVWTRTKILSPNICFYVAIFSAFMVTVEKIITNALGEHDPGSAQNGRTSNEMWSPAW